MLVGSTAPSTSAKSAIRTSTAHSRGLKLARSQSGIYLIEFLAALAISTIIAQFLIDSISETHRFATDGQGQLLATAVAEEVVDFARASGYPSLENLIAGSPHTLPINSGDAPVDPAFPRLLVMDLQNLVWSQPALSNKFDGTVTESVTYCAAWPDMIQVNVNVQWNQSSGMNRQYKLTTLVSKYGIQ